MKTDDVQLYQKMQTSPIYFVMQVWGLKPQPLKRTKLKQAENAIRDNDWDAFQADWFEDFQKGKHITWQQWLILLAVQRAARKEGKNRISIASGHGIGKSTVLSWLVLWYMFCHKNAQIPCTAPTSEQMNDVLWKEISIWLSRMPEWMQEKYDWSTGYIRFTESPETWFARARTARKENPEALAGVHGDYVMYAIDEASGIDDSIYRVAEGALTGENVLVVMISNPSRLVGYFYESHHKDKQAWQTLSFSSEDSPIVEEDYVDRMVRKEGKDSDEYKIRVQGQFPSEDAVDTRGYVPLFLREDIKEISDVKDTDFVGGVMGIDPAGEGKNETIWVLRDRFKAKVIGKESVSNPKQIAQKTVTLMELYRVKAENVYIDNFGQGANVAQEIALAEGIPDKAVKSVNVGDNASSASYMNKKAECYMRMKEWMRSGGELVRNEGWEQLLNIRHRRELSGKMKIMGKHEMRMEGYQSPDVPDALALTFWDKDPMEKRIKQYKPNWQGYRKQGTISQ